MPSGSKRIKDPESTSDFELNFESRIELDLKEWKSSSEWVSLGRLPNNEARSSKGLYHRRDTKGILEDYNLEEWLSSGLPF